VFAFTAKGIAEKSGNADTIRHARTSPVGIGLEIGMIVLLVALAQIDWEKHLGKARSRPAK
jgi:hypothetical protein